MQVCQRLATGEASVPPVGQRMFEQSFLGLAELLWEECAVDRLVDQLMATLFTTTDDQGRTLAPVDTYAAGYDVMVRAYLDALCHWVQVRVQRYRETYFGLAEIWQEGAPRLEELFTALSHAIGHFSATVGVDTLQARLAESSGFAAFLADDWSELVLVLELPRVEAVPRLRDVFLRTMKRLGFSADMTERGLHVYVQEPRFCQG
jgi:hypothetical protein